MKFTVVIYLILITQTNLLILSVGSQIINGNTDTNNLLDETPQTNSPEKVILETAVNKLTESIVQLSTRLSNLETKLDVKFKTLGEALNEEKNAIEVLNLRLDTLDLLTVKVNGLDSKVDLEASILRTTIKAINKDLQELEERPIDIAPFETATQGMEASSTAHIFSTDDRVNDEETRNIPYHSNEEETSIGELVVERIEQTLPRLLAAELNHFYLNMASKLDHSIRELQKEVLTRLRRIEGTTKTALLEIENGRQDISHLSHLQRSTNRNITATLQQEFATRNNDNSQCTKLDLESEVKNLILQINQNLSNSVLQSVADLHRNLSNREEQSHSKHPDLWGAIFSKGVASSQTSLKIPVAPTKYCMDVPAFDTLQEVKQLLRTLVTKGEDLKRSLTKQTNEGVDLLKLLHQRFSVLLRRMNTDPGNGEALLAEVQELEHLVENSYSSILLAQNVFIESCHRIQQQQPTIEGKIVDILNHLVTNIDLGHQFNRKQLQEVRKLIEQIAEDDDSKNLSFISSWLTSKTLNPSPEKLAGNIPKDKFFSYLVMTVAEANSTEEKLREVISRISELEVELQTIGWKSTEFKDTADELLTSAKDLKGYSRDQIVMMQNLEDEILEFVEIYTEFMDSVSSNTQTGTNMTNIGLNNALKNVSKETHGDDRTYFQEECSLSLLRQFRKSSPDGGSQDSRASKNGSISSDTEKVRLKKEVKSEEGLEKHDKVSSRENENIKKPILKARKHYDMLMDQDYIDLQSHFNSKSQLSKNILEMLNASLIKKQSDEEPNKMTILEDDFLI